MTAFKGMDSLEMDGGRREEEGGRRREGRVGFVMCECLCRSSLERKICTEREYIKVGSYLFGNMEE